eukprot:6333027-Prymnesium_polylepis.1
MAEAKGTGSAAMLSSQINGGGCLPPPTPGPQPKTLIELIADASSKNFVAAAGEKKVAKGWESSAHRSMREGAGKDAQVISMEASAIPHDISDVRRAPAHSPWLQPVRV